MTKFMNPSYYHLMDNIKKATGYTESWKSTWEDPNDPDPSNTTIPDGEKRILLNFFNMTDVTQINQLYAIDSDRFITALINEGTKVLLRVGTHDSTVPFQAVVSYVNHLRDQCVPLHFQIFYRFGHYPPKDVLDGQPDLAEQLNSFFGQPVTWYNELTEHIATNPAHEDGYEKIDPDHIPLTVELPTIAGAAQDHTWSFVGEPGSRVRVGIRPLPFNPPYEDYYPLPSQVLDAPAGDEFAFECFHWPLPGLPSQFEGPGLWQYRVDYSPDGDEDYDVSLRFSSDVAPPNWRQQPPLYWLLDHETKGWHDYGDITGGVAEDDQLLE
jgi:hypothetical protein